MRVLNLKSAPTHSVGSMSAAHRDKSREWNVSTQKWIALDLSSSGILHPKPWPINSVGSIRESCTSSSLLLSSLKLSDAQVYEPLVQALLGTASHSPPRILAHEQCGEHQRISGGEPLAGGQPHKVHPRVGGRQGLRENNVIGFTGFHLKAKALTV